MDGQALHWDRAGIESSPAKLVTAGLSKKSGFDPQSHGFRRTGTLSVLLHPSLSLRNRGQLPFFFCPTAEDLMVADFGEFALAEPGELLLLDKLNMPVFTSGVLKTAFPVAPEFLSRRRLLCRN